MSVGPRENVESPRISKPRRLGGQERARYASFVTLAEQLNRLQKAKETPAERFRQALSMYDEGVELQRMNFKRRNPDLSEASIDELMAAWLLRENDT